MDPERFTPTRRVHSLPASTTGVMPDTIARPSSASPLTSPNREVVPGKRETLWQEPPETLSNPKNHPSFSESHQGRPRFDSKIEQKLDFESSFVRPDNTPLVFPFIPAPTLSLDEVALPNPYQAEHATNKGQNPTDRSHVADISDQMSAREVKPCVEATDPEAATDGTNPRCTLQYLRAIPSEQSHGYALIHGQVWRAGGKRSGWRRNQWVVNGW